MPNKIFVEIYQVDKNPGAVGIIVETEDGYPPTAQEILDAVADALLYDYDNHTLEPQDNLDS